VSLGQAPPVDFCNAYDARAHWSERSILARDRAPEAPFPMRPAKERASRACPAGAGGARRELVSEGLARMRAPLLIVAPEHPGRRTFATKGLETPAHRAEPTKTRLRHRSAKSDGFRRAEVLSTVLELRFPRIAPRSSNPTPAHAAGHFRGPALQRDVAPSSPPRGRLALVSQALRGGSVGHGQRAFAPRTARSHG